MIYKEIMFGASIHLFYKGERERMWTFLCSDKEASDFIAINGLEVTGYEAEGDVIFTYYKTTSKERYHENMA